MEASEITLSAAILDFSSVRRFDDVVKTPLTELEERGIEKMTDSYQSMWKKYDIPGNPASNPVKTDKWEVTED